MDIWISWAKRKTTCRYCEKLIEAGTPVIRGKLWRKLGTATKWSYYYYWHPECWLKEAYAYLEAHPYHQTVGRPRLSLSEEDRQKRLSILRERARLIWRLKELILLDNDEAVSNIMLRLEELRAEIEPLGGVPKSWDKPLFKE